MTRLARTVLTALFISNPWVIQAGAEENLVTISSPADGEKLAAGKTYKVDYEVKEATKAHHVHLFVDGEEVANGHKLKGSGGAYGFPVLTDLGAAIEDAALERNTAVIRQKTLELEEYLGKIDVRYR